MQRWLLTIGAVVILLGLAWLFAKTVGLLAIAIAVGVRVTPRIFKAAARLRAPGVLLSVAKGAETG